MFQYEPALRGLGINVKYSPFFSNEYLTLIYGGQRARASVISAYLRRLLQMGAGFSADLLWIEKEALPWVPFLIERAFIPKSSPIVMDYDDAVFHRYDLHPSFFVRRLLASKIDRLMAVSDLVIAGNAYLAARAEAAGARHVEIVPTVVDLEAYRPAVARPVSDSGTIGWIGTPSTWTEFLAAMMPLLLDVVGREGGRVMAVGAGRSATSHPLFDNLPWSEDTEITQIQAMDIGIMPLTDTPWARGKCGYKLIQYMACGLPVVASPVGVNAEIVEHGVNGFLASSETEWREALASLLCDPVLRQKMGAAGRQKVEKEFSLQVWGPRVATMLRDAAEKKNSCSI